MTGSLLLLLIGSADLVRARHPSRRGLWLVAAAWLAVSAVTVTGLGLPLWSLAVAVTLSVGWMLTTSHDRPTRAGVWPAVALGVAQVSLLAVDTTAASSAGYLTDWHAESPSPALRILPVAAILLGVGLAMFLTESANLVVRAAIRLDPTTAPPRVSTARRTRWGRWAPDPASPPPAPQLRGGRLIGPLERLLLVSLVLSGLYVVAGAIIAAKGIVRFPEISRDDVGGSKAEYFLVGSLVSWTLALASAGLLLASAAS